MLCKGFLLFYIGSGMVFSTIAIILIELITISLPEWLAFVLMPVFLIGLLFMLVGEHLIDKRGKVNAL